MQVGVEEYEQAGSGGSGPGFDSSGFGFPFSDIWSEVSIEKLHLINFSELTIMIWMEVEYKSWFIKDQFCQIFKNVCKIHLETYVSTVFENLKNYQGKISNLAETYVRLVTNISILHHAMHTCHWYWSSQWSGNFHKGRELAIWMGWWGQIWRWKQSVKCMRTLWVLQSWSWLRGQTLSSYDRNDDPFQCWD